MAQLDRCSHCSGFLPASSSGCPHCGGKIVRRRTRSRAMALLALAGTSGVALTLMACYGTPCARDPEACQGPPLDMSVPIDSGHGPSPDGGTDGGE